MDRILDTAFCFVNTIALTLCAVDCPQIAVLFVPGIFVCGMLTLAALRGDV